ncbi:MAG: hypothetical protein ACRDMZ_10475 [Solirubrobacteraceae bacterium]
MVVAASFAGWWTGIGIGFLVVVIVVILVSFILTYAARILDQALEGIWRMDMARVNTLSVWRVQEINLSVTGIWRDAERARRILEGGS